MKARKVNLRNYKVEVNASPPLLNKILTTTGVVTCLQNSKAWEKDELNILLNRRIFTQEYNVKDSIFNILFMLRVSGREAWEKRDPLAEKIKSSNNEVLLQIDDYKMLVKAFEQFQRPGKNEEELLKRVFGAEEVEMKEKKKGARRA